MKSQMNETVLKLNSRTSVTYRKGYSLYVSVSIPGGDREPKAGVMEGGDLPWSCD